MRSIDIVAIIPARKGSKRLPNKNSLPLAGKPLIQWTLDAVKDLDVIDMVVVTSDDESIIDLSIKAGVQVVTRPASLSDDFATSIDVVLHVLEVLKKKEIRPKRVLFLQPTSPLRRSKHILAAIKLMDETKVSGVVSVCELAHPVQWCSKLGSDLVMSGFIREDDVNKRSQDFERYYRINGAIYLTDVTVIEENKLFFDKDAKAYVMAEEESADIDTALDFKWCEFLISETHEK